MLRERYGFRGELRATGDVLRDQFLFLARAGFDAFEVKKDADAAAFVEALARYSVFYQPAGDARTAVQRARRDHARPGPRRPGPPVENALRVGNAPGLRSLRSAAGARSAQGKRGRRSRQYG